MTTADPEQIWKSEKCVSSFHLPFIWLFCLWFVLPFFGQTTSHLTLVPDVVISKISEDWFLISLKTQLRVWGGCFQYFAKSKLFLQHYKVRICLFFSFCFSILSFSLMVQSNEGQKCWHVIMNQDRHNYTSNYFIF